MKTIIAPTTENSMLNNGVFFNGTQFVNKYKDVLENKWVVNCYWTYINSIYGCEIADIKTNQFCIQYNIPNQKW